MKKSRPWTPGQAYLLPPSPRDWLPEGHLVYFILDVIEELDLSEIESAALGRDARGVQPYAPAMMVALLLYAYCEGVFSSRRIARATYESVAFRVLTGDQHPHFTRINAFRKEHLSALSRLFLQVLVLCRQAGLVQLGHVSLDGTKVQANASKHKAMSYDRMQEADARLTEEIAALLEEAERVDAAEDATHGDGDGSSIPDELHRREVRQAKIREAKAALEAEARQGRAQTHRELAEGCAERAETADTAKTSRLNQTLAKKHLERAAELLEDDDNDDDDLPFTTPDGLAKHRPPATPTGKPKPGTQRNFTDPDSRLMESGGLFLQAYNCQAVVDSAAQIIVAAAVTNHPADAENLGPMLKMAVANCEAAPGHLSADTGYWKVGVAEEAAGVGTQALVATERKKSWRRDDTVTNGEPPASLPPRDRMQWLMRTEAARALYARRKVVVEPVFGQIKEARGFRRFLLRGLDGARGEWSLMAITHNLLKLYRHGGLAPA